MSTIVCPHCGVTNVAGAAFCESCGKALPLASATGPRVVTAATLPASAAGHQMLSDQLLKHTKRAANTLLVVGILQALITLAIFFFASSIRQPTPHQALIVQGSIVGAVAAIFIALSFWARRSPLPASIVGFVLYGTLIAINVVTQINALKDAPPGTARGGIGGLGVGWLDILILIFLARGIQAAIEQRKLLRAKPLM